MRLLDQLRVSQTSSPIHLKKSIFTEHHLVGKIPDLGIILLSVVVKFLFILLCLVVMMSLVD